MSVASPVAVTASRMSPVAVSDVEQEIRASAILTGTFVASSVVNVREAREVVVIARVTAGSADNLIYLIPLLAARNADDTAPAATDDVWVPPQVNDGSVTAEVIDSNLTLLSGADFAATPEWGRVTVRPLLLKLENTAGTEAIRIGISIKCAWASWFHVQVADADQTGTLATMQLGVVRGV